MYIIERGTAAWLCLTARSAYDSKAVQLRLRGNDKNFVVFEQRLANSERIDAGVLGVYKCSDADKCEDC